jgi:hypothetical protein
MICSTRAPATCPQGEKIKDAFTPFPIDGKIPLNDAIDWHMDKSPNHVYEVMTPCNEEEGGKVLASVTYAERAYSCSGWQSEHNSQFQLERKYISLGETF